jgi:hypothetical protein
MLSCDKVDFGLLVWPIDISMELKCTRWAILTMTTTCPLSNFGIYLL